MTVASSPKPSNKDPSSKGPSNNDLTNKGLSSKNLKNNSSTASRYKRLSFSFVLLAAICLLWADIEIISSNPGFELGRIGLGLVTPDFMATENLLDAIINTLAFALTGVALANIGGFLLALGFRWRLVRSGCAFVRAIHELFWALIFIQVFGLSTLTGILAIAIPYSGIFAKVYAEILEESDKGIWQQLPNSGLLSSFFYTRLPLAWAHLKHYSLYRLECGIRSSAILGFIGLPTLGFHLETAFSQGQYSEAAALLYIFFIVIATLKYWIHLKLIPLYLLAAFVWLPASPDIDTSLLLQFVTHDIVPSPLRGEGGDWSALWPWLQTILQQAGPGLFNTLTLSLIALVGTGILTLLLFPVISRLFTSRWHRRAGHVGLVVLRSIPELILAFIFTLVVGPSMLPAIVALSLHNGAIIAYLMGQYSNSLNLRVDACTGLNRYCFEVVPRIYNQFLAFLFYRWEVIMRETAILGILGVHTLGFYIDSAFEELRYDRALVLILITAFANLLVDAFSRLLRQRLKLNQGLQAG